MFGSRLVLCEYVKRPVRNVFTSCRSSIFNFLNKGFVDSLKLEFVIKRIIFFFVLCVGFVVVMNNYFPIRYCSK